MTSSLAAFARLGAAAIWLGLALPAAAQDGASKATAAETPPAAQSAPARNSGPMLGRIQLVEDWAVGCDNRLSCEAVALVPDGAGQASYPVLVTLKRAGGAEGAAVVRLLGADDLRGRIELIVDNRRLARIKAEQDMVEITGPLALQVMRALASNYVFELRQGKAVLATPSLRGLPAALRYMDEVQGRVGSRGALVATGEAAAEQARAVPPLPAVPEGTPVADEPIAFTAEEQAAARRLAVCDALHDSAYPLETHRLDESHALVLLPCDAGEYNVSAVPLVATGAAGGRQLGIAPFDHMPGASGDPDAPPLIVNARWNPMRAELSSFAKGRGLGDCGTAETYKWDGVQFRLIEARSMPVCRGAWEWPVLYSAQGGE